MNGNSDYDIFLDLDGVIANFEGHAKATGISIERREFQDMGREWWATIPPFEGAFDFYKELCRLSKVRFLTGTILKPCCHSGKADWVMEFTQMGEVALRDLILCTSGTKYLLARPDAILIDDRVRVIDSWVEAGGIGILHKGDHAETLHQTRQVFQTGRKETTA